MKSWKKEKVEELSVFCLLDCPLTPLFETQFNFKKKQYEKYVVPHVQVELAWHNNTIPFKAPSSAQWNLAVALKLLTLDLIANSFYGRVILKYSQLFVVLQW